MTLLSTLHITVRPLGKLACVDHIPVTCDCPLGLDRKKPRQETGGQKEEADQWAEGDASAPDLLLWGVSVSVQPSLPAGSSILLLLHWPCQTLGDNGTQLFLTLPQHGEWSP